ncbi:6-phosphogluconate dehydratase [Plesiocystis pacifica SIR-1]|uniref:Phosphogluconate dehydratase n=1 Tax=Plesiocystis pacifica SIR-1 TaxID=391625 RepID=A6FX56_9BACT|nr:phosphogluconate dehydratase [Plesiocystis pacifica]EDM81880.1 6-phosphogluconate dehydratase [Plesiocystis pacifica SIR-1]
MPVHPTVDRVTRAIRERSALARARYLEAMDAQAASLPGSGNSGAKPARRGLAAPNLAHALAAAPKDDKHHLQVLPSPSVAIVTAYNDMLSAHQPYAAYPPRIKAALREVGAVGQVAGGVPAMCDGITQGYPGMELSLFSRDVIAMSAAVALSHGTFDAALCLGVCDKIVPGLLIGALRFGHLPIAFVPAGPMPSGLPNAQKAAARVRFANGEIDEAAILASELQAYHSAGTCTFYGTANTNQLLMEVMGLHLPGASFEPPDTALRHALTRDVAQRVARAAGVPKASLAARFDERAVVNGVVALLATGGSTNHTLHLPAIAAAAGIELRWEDMDALSAVVPLLTRMYPNGQADVNHFRAAGGTAYLISQLLDAGLIHGDVGTVFDLGTGKDVGLEAYRQRPRLSEAGALEWVAGPERSADEDVLRSATEPFAPDGGLRVIRGPLGRAVIKISAVAPAHRRVRARARVFEDPLDLLAAFSAGELEGDLVAVVRAQGPRAKGMPELHKLTAPLKALQQRGHAVALVTDGRMSGASGSVPAAIHLTPEAVDGGPIAQIRDGDWLELDAEAGELRWQPEGERAPATNPDMGQDVTGFGRELFAIFREKVGPADRGASVFANLNPEPASAPEPT